MRNDTVEPIVVATVWHTMQTVCREMIHVIDRTAQNYLIGQLHDLSVGIWTASGETVAVPEGLPVHFLSGDIVIKQLMEMFKDDLSPGDVILSNDPYRSQNVHLPDWGFYRPIFLDGEPVFWVMSRGHQQDSGGSFPGGYFPDAYDIHAEGIIIPPIKIYKAGRERRDVLQFIWNNTRWPEGIRLDNYAMMAALEWAERRLIALLRRYGKDCVLECVNQMLDRTEQAVREQIRRIPDGTYYGESATDDDGTEQGVPVWIRVEMTVRGDEITFDFSKSDAQRKGFVNTVYASTRAATMGAAVLFLDPALAGYHNQGSLRPIQVVARPGLVVNCQYPATVGASPVSMCVQVMEAVLQAFNAASPEPSVAAWERPRGDYTFGTDPRSGQRYVRVLFDYYGSAGAVRGYDGYPGKVSSLTTMGAVRRGSIEEEEIRTPWRILHYECATDLMGAGRWRGGPGVRWEAVNEGGEARIATGNSDGDETRPFALQPAEAPRPSRSYLRRNGEEIRVKARRMTHIQQGDVWVKLSSGGGGVGDPAERDPALVAEDVRDGIVSLEAARQVYKVVIRPNTWEVDEEQTRLLRAGALTASG